MTCGQESQTFAPIIAALGSTPNRRRVTVLNSTYCPHGREVVHEVIYERATQRDV